MSTALTLTQIRTELNQEAWKKPHQEAMAVRDIEEQIDWLLESDLVVRKCMRNIRAHRATSLRENVETQRFISEAGQTLLEVGCHYAASGFNVNRLEELSAMVSQSLASASAAEKFALALDAIIRGEAVPAKEFHCV